VTTRLITVGHGTLPEEEFVELLRGTGIESLVRPTDGVRRDDDHLVYDVGETGSLLA